MEAFKNKKIHFLVTNVINQGGGSRDLLVTKIKPCHSFRDFFFKGGGFLSHKGGGVRGALTFVTKKWFLFMKASLIKPKIFSFIRTFSKKMQNYTALYYTALYCMYITSKVSNPSPSPMSQVKKKREIGIWTLGCL